MNFVVENYTIMYLENYTVMFVIYGSMGLYKVLNLWLCHPSQYHQYTFKNAICFSNCMLIADCLIYVAVRVGEGSYIFRMEQGSPALEQHCFLRVFLQLQQYDRLN